MQRFRLDNNSCCEEIKSMFAKWVRSEYGCKLRVLHHLFNKNDIDGKLTLDIGAGCGETIGFFIIEFGALRGTAVDLYEGGGSKKEWYQKITELQMILKDQLEVVKCDIWNFVPKCKYGFIYAISSLHHILESKRVLKNNPELEQRAAELFRKIGSWLDDNGKFVFFELARRNWSPIPKYRKRYKTVVDLSTKQDSWNWINVLKKSGFKKVFVKYPTPVILDKFKYIHSIFNNYLMCILTGSGYLIEASGFK